MVKIIQCYVYFDFCITGSEKGYFKKDDIIPWNLCSRWRQFMIINIENSIVAPQVSEEITSPHIEMSIKWLKIRWFNGNDSKRGFLGHEILTSVNVSLHQLSFLIACKYLPFSPSTDWKFKITQYLKSLCVIKIRGASKSHFLYLGIRCKWQWRTNLLYNPILTISATTAFFLS
jgi:hypothetical protein